MKMKVVFTAFFLRSNTKKLSRYAQDQTKPITRTASLRLNTKTIKNNKQKNRNKVK